MLHERTKQEKLYQRPVLCLWFWAPLLPVTSVLPTAKFDWFWAVQAVNGIHGLWRYMYAHTSYVLVQHFQDDLSPVFWLGFTLFVYIRYMDYCWTEQWILFLSCLPHSERNFSEKDSTPTPCRQSNGCQCSVHVWWCSLEPAKWDCRVGTGNCLDTCDF